jgi:hypothetical protein
MDHPNFDAPDNQMDVTILFTTARWGNLVRGLVSYKIFLYRAPVHTFLPSSCKARVGADFHHV